MKRIRIIELFAEIKANLVAFLSVSMFVGLGLALFLGIQWGAEALKNALDTAYEEGNMYDIEVSFPYGLTEDDLAQLKNVEGVSEIEPAYSAYAVMNRGVERYVLKVLSLTDRINTPTLVDGALPTKKGEIAITDGCAESQNIKVGDVIKLKHDAKDTGDEKDADGMANLMVDTLTVTGIIHVAPYNYRLADGNGVSNIGAGKVDIVGYTTTATFDAESYHDGYPDIFIRCDSLRGISAMDAEYRTAAAPIINEITELGGKLGAARYDEIHGEAQEKIDDAQAEVDDGERKLADAQQQIADGERAIADGQQEIIDGQNAIDDAQQQIDDGQAQLDSGRAQAEAGARELEAAQQKLNQGTQDVADGRKTLSENAATGAQQLEDARVKLEAGQATYDANLKSYESSKGDYENMKAQFAEKEEDYIEFMGCYVLLKSAMIEFEPMVAELQAALAEYATGGDWAKVGEAYQNAGTKYQELFSAYGALGAFEITEWGIFGMPFNPAQLPEPTIPDLVENEPQSAQPFLDMAGETITSCNDVISDIENTSVTMSGATVHLISAPQDMETIEANLAAGKAQLDAAKAQLDESRAQYDASKALYDQKIAEGEAQIEAGQRQVDEGRAEIDANREKLDAGRAEIAANQQTLTESRLLLAEKIRELATGKSTLAEKRKELADGKKELTEKKQELEDGKKELEEGKEALADMVEYEWVVTSRPDCGPATGGKTMYGMMGNMRWAMALLFIVVGLFVCYSAISRLVHEQVVQIGTKKALGFRRGEITAMYLSFSGASTLIGIIMALLIAVFLVQGVMNPTVAAQYTMPAYGPHLSIPELLLFGGVELLLILAATAFAINGMLKREALELLGGESTANVKERFYERWAVWKKMSLFSQTVVNNCVNDPRRVVGTLVGVVGCTALIVTAVMLNDNVAKSFERHYENVYDYDAIVYLEEESDADAHAVASGLFDQGIACAPGYERKLQVRKDDGSRTLATMVVPTNPQAFEEYYCVHTVSGEDADIEAGGLWVNSAYGDHMHAQVGDEITLTEFSGKTHTFKIAGFFEYYLLRQEFILCTADYNAAFGEQVEPNMLFLNTDGADLNKARDALDGIKGYLTLIDDKADASYAFDQIRTLLTTVVLIYLALSALMALMVLLNLDIMFVMEKKRELIVLMINGFSVKAAQAYIYRDSIVLTIIGIILGIVLGSVVGSFTVAALEPEFGTFIKSFNGFAAIVGALGAGIFALGVLWYALRKIAKFDLTDINRF